MDEKTGRPDHIEDVLVRLHGGQWFGFSDPNHIYANLIVHSDDPKPSEQSLNDELAKMQSDFDDQEYARKRKNEYPSIEELVVALYDPDDRAAIDAKRTEIKAKFPKP